MGEPRTPYRASLVAGAMFFAFLLAVPAILADTDTLWQIHTGEWILQHRAIPHVDPFSYTAAGQRWFAHEWLAETIMALANRAGGSRGVMVLAAAAAGLTLGLLLYHLRRFMALPPALVVMLTAIVTCSVSLLARPHLLAWPCLELWSAGLVLARARRSAPSWWLLPVMILWVNLHGSFIIGLLLPFPFMVEALIEARANWRGPAIAWSQFIGAAWIVALLNPDTYETLLFPFQLTGMHNLNWIGEWQPADFSAFNPLEAVIVMLLGMGLLGYLTVPPLRLLMMLGLIHMALQHARHAQLVGLLGALVLAEAIGRIAPRPEQEETAPRVLVFGLPILAVLLPAVALVIRFAIPLKEEPGASVFATLDKLPPTLRARPVLNDYPIGAYLIAHGDRPFIDSRADMYGDAFLGRFRQITDLKPGALDAALRDYDVTWTIFRPDAPVLQLLDRQPGWRRLIVDPDAVVHVRDSVLPR